MPVAQQVQLAHVSDIHVTADPIGWQPADYLSKRYTGWLNFRWLRRALDALVVLSTAQEGREKPKVPVTTYLASLFRYGLLGFTVYVIFILLHVPLGSMIVGFCALAAAAIVASVWEILSPAG